MQRAWDEDMAHWIADQLQDDISHISAPGYGVLRFRRNGVWYQLQVERDPNANGSEPVQRGGLPSEEHEPTPQELKTAIKALESLVKRLVKSLQWRGDRFSTRLDALENGRREQFPRKFDVKIPMKDGTKALADLPSQTALEDDAERSVAADLTRRIIKLESGKTDRNIHQDRVLRALDTRLTELEWYHPELERERDPSAPPQAELPGRTYDDIQAIRQRTEQALLQRFVEP